MTCDPSLLAFFAHPDDEDRREFVGWTKHGTVWRQPFQVRRPSRRYPRRLFVDPFAGVGVAMPVPESFRTARLEAERITPSHLAGLIEFHRDPDVMVELGGIRDEEQTSQYLSRNLEHWVEHGFGVWVLRERAGSELIGRAILRYLPVQGTSEIEIGFALYPQFWGRGLATEVAETCTALAWRELGATSLVGVTTPVNRASQRVLLKIGLHYEREVVIEEAHCWLYRATSPTSEAAAR